MMVGQMASEITIAITTNDGDWWPYLSIYFTN